MKPKAEDTGAPLVSICAPPDMASPSKSPAAGVAAGGGVSRAHRHISASTSESAFSAIVCCSARSSKRAGRGSTLAHRQQCQRQRGSGSRAVCRPRAQTSGAARGWSPSECLSACSASHRGSDPPSRARGGRGRWRARESEREMRRRGRARERGGGEREGEGEQARSPSALALPLARLSAPFSPIFPS
eukprot:scaffold151508_cov29-Tisochrysis_lutea.AAC.1